MVKPRRTEIYLAEAERFAEVVNDYRAAGAGASAETSVTEQLEVEPQCNKRKSYRLPPLPIPTEIPGYPLNPTPPAEAPDYVNLARVKAIRATQAARLGKR